MDDLSTIILDSIADGVFTVDRDFRITYLNRAARKILGVREDEAKGMRCSDLMHASICEHSCVLAETMATGEPIVNRTVFIVRPGGERIPVSVSTALLRNEAGEVSGGVETFRDISEIEMLRDQGRSDSRFEDMVSINGAMRHIFSLLPDIAFSDATVLITGESGTGKELVARALHRLSDRSTMPFVTVNCAALPDQLIESELFGHVAGAFTDARRDRQGRIAKAEGGSLFLDEIGDLSPPVQVKLLRFLQERTYEPLGSNRVMQASVRIIAATNSDLNLEVEEGRFRRDFYYRLNVMNIHLPSLRHRREDIPLLMEYFLARQNLVQKKEIAGFSDRVLDVLLDYDFPGNIRELENIVEHAVILCRSSYIEIEHLPAYFRNFGKDDPSSLSLEEIEKRHIKKVLAKNGYNRNKTASELGINPSTLWRKMKKWIRESD